MDTGLFRLFRQLKDRKAISDFLNNSSFDELTEFNITNDNFTKLFYTAKKYSSPLTEGSFKELFLSMSELVVHPDDKARFCGLIDPVTLRFQLQKSEIPGIICDEFRFHLLSDNWCWVEVVLVSGSFMDLPEDIYRMYVFDVHSRKTRELGLNDEYVHSDRNRDETTGLLREKAFMKEVEKLTRDTSVKWCVIMADIDNFKLFNEWYGHSSGDLLMARIGSILKKTSEDLGGTAGYFGLDDFCLLIPFDKKNIDDLYENISTLISSSGNNSSFKPAFGISLVDEDSRIHDIVDRAFLAVRVAKQGYRHRIQLYDPGMYTKADAEYRIVSDFMQAVKKHEIIFYLQPQCRASTGKIVGAEALCRWVLPDGSLVPPNHFIPALEKHGLITDLDHYIWEEVCKWQMRWIMKGNTPLPVSVNISTIDIRNIDIAQVLTDLTEKYKLPHNLLKIEITESSYADNADLVSKAVHSLREKGFTVMMDDFGSRYSTLNMLKNLSVDVIKLDAQFLHMDESNSERSIHIIESINSMAKTIGLPIIAEGVENEKQKTFLQDMGCRYIQGYYFYRPMDTKSYEELIADHNKIDTSGITFKSNQQFKLREILDNNVYSDTMLNNILGPCAFYSWDGEDVDIIRYNEQFYEAVDVPDFVDRLDKIQRFLPPADVERIHLLLQQAKEDKLNGAKGLLHFYKTDGTLTTFYMRFYYLRREKDRDIFYGAVQNITRLSTLEKQILLLSRFSPDTVIFMTRKPNGSVSFSVLFNGLEEELGMTRETLEAKLNSFYFSNRISPDNPDSPYTPLLEYVRNSKSFETVLNIPNSKGKTLKLNVFGDYIIDDTDTMDYIITARKAASENE